MRKLLAVVTSLFVCIALASCSDSEPARQGIGEVERVDDIAGTPIARALGLEVFKFDYSLRDGHYDVHLWLEQDDVDTSGTSILRDATCHTTANFDGGSVVVGIGDPATSEPETGKNWRVVLSHDYGADKVISACNATYLLPNMFYGLNGGINTQTADELVIHPGKEMTLITWAGGETVFVSGSTARREREIRLKMKVVVRDDGPDETN